MDISKYIPKTASCPDFGDWACKKGYDIPWNKAKRGDIVLFDFNNNRTSDHIGIVTKATNSYIETIEGNTGNGSNTNGDGVYRRKRYKSQVNYFVRPKMPESYRELIIATAQSQLGYKEGRGNNNKYGRAFGANNCAWCCIFVWWLFKNCKGKVEKIEKPTGTHTLWIPSVTLKLGSKGVSVKALQEFLNWYHPAWKLKTDSEFGELTEEAVRAFQRAEGIEVDGIFGKDSIAKARKYLGVPDDFKNFPIKEEAKPKAKYTGAMPDFVALSAQIIVAECKRLAYPLGTSKSKYSYGKGKATKAFTKAIDRVFPNRSWSAQCRAGASCDVGAATVLRSCGADTKIPRGLQEQFPHMAKSKKFKDMGLKSTKKFKAGDVGMYMNKSAGAHIWINIDGKTICESNHTAKYFLHMVKRSYSSIGKKKFHCYRMVKPIREYLQLGDVGAEVKKVQRFLNWYGNYKLGVDGDFGKETESAVKKFQTNEKLQVDGIFGKACVKVAKKVYR